MQNEYVHVFARLGADLHARSVLVDKISVSKLSRKFIEIALLVGYKQNFLSKKKAHHAELDVKALKLR